MTIAVAVIEADPNQWVGARMQFESLLQRQRSTEYRLTIVDRGSGEAEHLLKGARSHGIEARLATTPFSNPFLNRWLVLTAFPELARCDSLAMVDWDWVCLSTYPIPQPTSGRLLARRNPPSLYRHLAAQISSRELCGFIDANHDVPSSINGGVLIGSGETLMKCAKLHRRLCDQLTQQMSDAPDWAIEQLSLSLSVGMIGCDPLDDRWNVTPTSPVADESVYGWHYNDGDDASRKLKRGLADRGQVFECCEQLSSHWPRTMLSFLSIYDGWPVV